MKDNLILQDKNYISAKRAAQIFAYTSDYIGQLCRAGKLDCKMIGRSWFVTEESITKHQISFSPESTPKAIAEIPKIIEVEVEPKVEVLQTLSFVPKIFALPQEISSNFLFVSKPVHSNIFHFDSIELAFTSLFFVLSLGIAFQSLSKNSNVVADISNSQATASIISNSFNVIKKVTSLFPAGPQLAINNKTEIKSQSDFNGLAVVASSNSPERDEVIKSKIRKSFSDEVAIKPDASGTAGIITPVFRKAKGDDFVYVLVPVKNQ